MSCSARPLLLSHTPPLLLGYDPAVAASPDAGRAKGLPMESYWGMVAALELPKLAEPAPVPKRPLFYIVDEFWDAFGSSFVALTAGARTISFEVPRTWRVLVLGASLQVQDFYEALTTGRLDTDLACIAAEEFALVDESVDALVLHWQATGARSTEVQDVFLQRFPDVKFEFAHT